MSEYGDKPGIDEAFEEICEKQQKALDLMSAWLLESDTEHDCHTVKEYSWDLAQYTISVVGSWTLNQHTVMSSDPEYNYLLVEITDDFEGDEEEQVVVSLRINGDDTVLCGVDIRSHERSHEALEYLKNEKYHNAEIAETLATNLLSLLTACDVYDEDEALIDNLTQEVYGAGLCALMDEHTDTQETTVRHYEWSTPDQRHTISIVDGKQTNDGSGDDDYRYFSWNDQHSSCNFTALIRENSKGYIKGKFGHREYNINLDESEYFDHMDQLKLIEAYEVIIEIISTFQRYQR